MKSSQVESSANIIRQLSMTSGLISQHIAAMFYIVT